MNPTNLKQWQLRLMVLRVSPATGLRTLASTLLLHVDMVSNIQSRLSVTFAFRGDLVSGRGRYLRPAQLSLPGSLAAPGLVGFEGDWHVGCRI